MHEPRRRRSLWIVAAMVTIAAAAVWTFWYERHSTYHFAVVKEGALYRDGNRSMRQFAAACRKARIKTIVALNDDSEFRVEPFKSEVEFCEANNIKLHRIRIAPGERPTTEDVQKFLEIASDPGNQPVLVHCAQGLRRTGMMVAAYQLSLMNCTPQQAKDLILLWGRKSERLDDVRGFIDDFDPVKRTVGSAHIVDRGEDAD